jgi:hypothetical protein
VEHIVKPFRGHIPLSLMLRFPRLLGGYKEETVMLGPPIHKPLMSRSDVLAEATRISHLVRTHRCRLRYGSFHDWSRHQGTVRDDGTVAWKTRPAFDAWTVTIYGLSLPRPSRGGSTRRPPPFSTLILIIDDKAKTYYRAVGE